MPHITLNEAEVNDIPLISELAQRIWNQHYLSIIGQAQVDYMLNLMYSHKSLSEQMQEKKHQFFLVMNDEETIGFISVNKEQNNDWFLNKFYIDQTLAAKGNGALAFSTLVEKINPSTLTLTCNRQNFKAINFYFKLGFKIERVADFDIGNNYVMNDFVMVWKRSS
jgi:diamine N-acetyltransferase